MKNALLGLVLLTGCTIRAAAPPPTVAIAPDGTQGVYRLFNGRDHMDSLVPGEGGYNTENGGMPLFHAFAAPRPGTIEIRRCYSPRTRDHLLSMDAGRECPPNGYVIEGVLGYVFPVDVANARPVRRCWNGRDHLSTVDPRECVANGYEVEAGFWAL